MKPLTILGIVAAAIAGLAFKKKNDYSLVIEKMTWDIRNIRNLRTKIVKENGVDKWYLYFDMDVAFHNHTPYEFDFDTAGYILLRKINVFHKGKMLGTAVSNTTKFSLEPNGNYLIEKIQVQVSIADAVNDLLLYGLDVDPENYSLQLQVEALLQTFIIDQPLAV